MNNKRFESVNPATGEVFVTTQASADDAIEQKLAQPARQAKRLAQSDYQERRALLEAVADQLDSGRDRLTSLVIAKKGKLAGEARAEADK